MPEISDDPREHSFCTRCHFREGFKAGLESAIESYEKYKKPALIEAAKFQARQDERKKVLEEEIKFCNEIMQNDKTEAYGYGKDKQDWNRKGEFPEQGKRWLTPFEMTKNRIRKLEALKKKERTRCETMIHKKTLCKKDGISEHNTSFWKCPKCKIRFEFGDRHTTIAYCSGW